jgi:YesN/AraC family two-component response regulator
MYEIAVENMKLDSHIDPREKIHTFTCFHDNVLPHSHSFLELVYVLDGTAVHGMNGVETVVSAGDYFIIDLGDRHYYNSCEKGRLKIQNLLFEPAFVDKMLVNAKGFSEVLNCYLVKCSNSSGTPTIASRIFHDDDKTVRRLVESIAFEYSAKRIGYLETIRCDLIKLIIGTIRKADRGDNSIASAKVTDVITKYISKHYSEQISLADACREYGYSASYISRKFKEENAMTFSRYLQQVRINEACRLLLSEKRKILDAASSVGYTDIKFFNELFKKYTGSTPREYKRLAKG